MTDAVDAARDRMGRTLLAHWEQKEINELLRLLQKFAEDIETQVSRAGK